MQNYPAGKLHYSVFTQRHRLLNYWKSSIFSGCDN